MTNVNVITRNLDNLDEPGNHVVIDYDNHDHRKWLGRHSFWAMYNNRSVFSEPTDKAVTFVDKRSHG
jgi:hypothetical protein